MSSAHSRLLAGLRIIDAGQVLAGPFVSTLLADLGADVIGLNCQLLKINLIIHIVQACTVKKNPYHSILENLKVQRYLRNLFQQLMQ